MARGEDTDKVKDKSSWLYVRGIKAKVKKKQKEIH